MDSKAFGEAVKKILDERGIKYAWAAEQMGWSRQLLYAKLLGENQWKLDEVTRAIKLFDLPKDILM